MMNRLNNQRGFLAGPDDGWRSALKDSLVHLGIYWVDGYFKQAIDIHLHQGGLFSAYETYINRMMDLNKRLVSHSDFVVWYIDTEATPCDVIGFETFVDATQQRKPVVVCCKQGKAFMPTRIKIPDRLIFDDIRKVSEYLRCVNSTKDDHFYNLEKDSWFFV